MSDKELRKEIKYRLIMACGTNLTADDMAIMTNAMTNLLQSEISKKVEEVLDRLENNVSKIHGLTIIKPKEISGDYLIDAKSVATSIQSERQKLQRDGDE